jgi:hypothetical protein
VTPPPRDAFAAAARHAVERHDEWDAPHAFDVQRSRLGWEQYERDRIGRTFHKRADATEACIVWVADVHGRLWSATKARDNPGRIHEVFYQPGRAPGGHLVKGLLRVAYATGMSAWGLPGPQGRMN